MVPRYADNFLLTLLLGKGDMIAIILLTPIPGKGDTIVEYFLLSLIKYPASDGAMQRSWHEMIRNWRSPGWLQMK